MSIQLERKNRYSSLSVNNNNNNNDNDNNNSEFIQVSRRIKKTKKNNTIKWSKAHYRKINDVHYYPYQLTNAVLQYLLEKSKINFDMKGDVIFKDFPSLVKSISGNTFDPRSIISKKKRSIKVKELNTIKDNTKNTITVKFENAENTTKKYEMEINENYMKELITYLPYFIKKSESLFSLNKDTLNIDLGDISNIKNDHFVYDKTMKEMKLQKFTLGKFFNMGDKQYILFGSPDPHKMSHYYFNGLSDEINKIMNIQSSTRLEKLREFWNKFNLTKQLNGDNDWLLSDLGNDKNKESVHLKYVLEDKFPEFETIIKENVNDCIKKVLSRGDTRIKYIFHVFEINYDEKDKIKLISPIKRIRDIKSEHKELLEKINNLIIEQIYNQTDFQFQNPSEINGTSPIKLDNLLIYSRNSGYFHFEVEYIDSLSNFHNYYYILNNIIQIDDLINGCHNDIWSKIDLISFISKNKLKEIQTGGLVENIDFKDKFDDIPCDYKEFLQLSGTPQVIVFNIKSNKECIVILKKGSEYFYIKLIPNLNKINIKIEDIKKTEQIFTSTYLLTNAYNIYRYKVWKLDIERFQILTINLKPVLKIVFSNILNFFKDQKIKISKESEFDNPGHYIPFIGLNFIYNYLELYKKQKLKKLLPSEFISNNDNSNNDNNFEIYEYKFEGEKHNQDLKDMFPYPIEYNFKVINMKEFEYLVLFHSDIKQNTEYVKKVIWLIPKFKDEDIESILNKFENNKQKKLTIDDIPNYLANPYTISPSNLLKLEKCLFLVKKIVEEEIRKLISDITNNKIKQKLLTDLSFKNHLFYTYSQSCFHLHLSPDFQYNEPSKDEGLISRLGRTIFTNRYINYQKEGYYNNNNINIIFFQNINYTQQVMMLMNESTSSLNQLQLGGNGDINNNIKKFIFNKSKYKLENDLLNIVSNIEKIFHHNGYLNDTHMNLGVLLRSQEIIDKYFLNNMNILFITNLFNPLIPIIYNKKNNNNTIDLLLLKNIHISKYNNTLYINELKNSKNIKTIIGDYNTDIEEFNNYNLQKYDLIVIHISSKIENKNNKLFTKIVLNNLKNNGKLIIKKSMENINKNYEITSLINQFNNYKFMYYINSEIFRLSHFIEFSGFKPNPEELNNNNTSSKVNKFILENNNIFKIRTNEIDNEINYFNNDPENYINRYFIHISNLLYNTIFYLDKNKIPYNKYYLILVNNYYQHNINELFTLGNPINQKIIKYKNIDIKSKSKKTKKNIHKTSKKTKKNKDVSLSKINVSSYKSYTYNYFDDIIDELSYVKNIRKKIINLYGISYLTKVTKISEDFTKGLSNYLSTNFKLPFKPSNAFTKIWEIYETFNLFDKNQNTYKTFHFAEAPGQFIWSTEYYLKKQNKNAIFDWWANSLNHNHPKNKKIFGNVFGDDYGFIKNFKNKWLYGFDNTGDITVSKNIKFIGKQIKEKGIFDVVTGDAGLSTDMDLLFLQKLEFAQVCMVAATASLNKNCIVKHFTPFINSDSETNLAGGQFVNMIYLYSLMFKNVYLFKPYTSRSTSGEFYVIGKGFLGVSDIELDKLLNILDNFKINQTYFNKNDIPEDFYRQIFTFIDKMSKLNTLIIERQNFFMTCLIEPNEEIRKETKCLQYLEPKKLEKIHNSRYKEWIDLFNFS